MALKLNVEEEEMVVQGMRLGLCAIMINCTVDRINVVIRMNATVHLGGVTVNEASVTFIDVGYDVP